MGSTRDIEDALWPTMKTMKIKELVDFLSLDQDGDFLFFRKFQRLNLSSLLHQQNQLIALEERILKIDTEPDMTPPEQEAELDRLLRKAACQLEAYNSALLQQSKILELSSPPRHLTDFLLKGSSECPWGLTWYVLPNAIEDLVALRSTSKGYIHGIIHSSRWLRRPFLKAPTETQPKGLDIFVEANVRRFEKALIGVVFSAIVLIPIYFLARVSSVEAKFLILAISVLLATLLVANGMDEYYRASLGFIVGYIAILVVFLGNTI